MTEKIVGYLLFIVGLLLVVYTAFDVYLVFTAKKMPIQLFQFPGISVDFTKLMPSAPTDVSGLPANIDIAKILSQVTAATQKGGQKQEMISAAMINVPLNYFTHLMLMGFLLNVGIKISGLGIQLIRPIVVKLRESPQTPPSPKNSGQ